MAIIEHDSYVDSSEYHPYKTCNVIIKTMDNMVPRYDHGSHGGPSYFPVPYYTPVPAALPTTVTPHATLDFVQIIAVIALLTFLLQSLLALLDRLFLPTRIVQARDEGTVERTHRILKAIDKYQSKNWEDKQNNEVKKG